MSRTVEIDDDDVVVRLGSWDALAALCREIRIPLAAITDVTFGRFSDEGWRLGGTSIPFTDVRAGRFRRAGRRQFLSFAIRDDVLQIRADRARGASYDLVVVQVPAPDSVARAIDDRRRGAVE